MGRNHFNNHTPLQQMRVEKSTWKDRLDNLINRRKEVGHTNDNFRTESPVADYAAHMRKVHIGNTLLDVGCGSCYLKGCIPEEVKYYGLDAVPLSEDVFHGMIEEDHVVNHFTLMKTIDTVCAFAVMDGCQDFDLACQNIKRIAKRNVVFLTGIGIEADEFHTHKLEISDFNRNFNDWESTVWQIAPKVYLLEYRRP